MPPPRTPADPRAIVDALERHGVDYVVVGGWAAVTYGVDRATFDLDVVVASGKENARALAGALAELGALRDLGGGITEPLPLDAPDALFAGPLRTLTDEGSLDVLTGIPGASYAQVRADARRAAFGDGTEFTIASKATLEAIKEEVARQADPARGDRDRLDLDALRALPDPDLPPAA